MAHKNKIRKVIQLNSANVSANMIEKLHHISKRTTKAVLERKEELEFEASSLDDYSDEELYQLFFPDQYASDHLYQEVNYEYIHKELPKKGVTLKLLWEEYCDAIPSGKYPVSYSTFCRDYTQYVDDNEFTNRIIHKPGVRTEVDWSGSKMHFTDSDTGEVVTVYLFVATLPFSQYSYVEPTLDMKMDTWINCNVHMFEFFGGSTIRVIPDNLKVGVISHPKEGDIILNETYEQFGDYYLTAIMPAQVRKPKQKASVEGTVGKVTTAIIAKLRNRKFSSFTELKIGVREALTQFNESEFQKKRRKQKTNI